MRVAFVFLSQLLSSVSRVYHLSLPLCLGLPPPPVVLAAPSRSAEAFSRSLASFPSLFSVLPDRELVRFPIEAIGEARPAISKGQIELTGYKLDISSDALELSVFFVSRANEPFVRAKKDRPAGRRLYNLLAIRDPLVILREKCPIVPRELCVRRKPLVE